MKRQRIAIVGSGISGLGAAWHLNERHDVTVFEASDRLGGHTHTVTVEMDGERHRVDTGFIVCNDRNYPNFMALMQRLGVPLKKSEMSFSVFNPRLDLEYNGHNLNTLFAQRRNVLRPRFYRLIRDILRFNRACKEAVATGVAADLTLAQFVREQAFGELFRDNYLLPMVAAIWSCSLRQASEFPLDFFLRFFLNHGLLDLRGRPQWYVVEGGSSSYIEPLSAGFAERLRLSTPVVAVRRCDAGVELRHGENWERFDRVILACHSDQALALLDAPSRQEREILSALPYQANTVTLHTDSRLMPRRNRAWASWNFLAGSDAAEALPVVTYSMNILQGIDSSRPLLVSLNASDRIDPDKVLRQFEYAHPVYSLGSLTAQRRRGEICGVDRIHYCGAYWHSGFHEDGLRSALEVCQNLEQPA